MAKKTFNLTDALDIAAEETSSPEVKKEPVRTRQEKPVVPETEKKEAEKIAYERIVSTSVYIQKCNVNFLRYVSAEQGDSLQDHLITLIEKEIRHFEGKPHKIPDFGSYKSRLRVAKEDSTQLSVRMPESKLAELKKAANYKHTSVSTFIDDILTRERERYVKENG